MTEAIVVAGKGQYGDVFLAKAHHIRGESEPETLVVVKSLLTRDEFHHREFRREIDMFAKANHEHVVRLLGLCREMEPQFLITEYCEWVSTVVLCIMCTVIEITTASIESIAFIMDV